MANRSRFDALETNAVHGGAPDHVDGAVVTPIFQSANYLMRDEATYDAVRYIRLHNSPNHHVLQGRLAALEGGEAAFVAASGMAVISAAILALAGNGDHLLAQSTLYGGTQSFLDEDAPQLGVSHTSIDISADSGPEDWRRALEPTTKLVLVESVSNPLMEVGNLRTVVDFAREHGLVTLIDNTFATPVNFRPLEIGIDLVVHSATKYLNGHSDIVAGAVVGSRELVDKVRLKQVHLGAALDPHACFLLERGLKTLVLRVERQNENARRLAEFLASHDAVRRVNYPGLVNDPGHRFASELFSGYGGMLSFYLADPDGADRFLDSLEIPIHAASLGGVETLVVQPSKSSHLGQTPEERERLGITDDLIRVSVGIEHVDELIADFERALAVVPAPVPDRVGA